MGDPFLALADQYLRMETIERLNAEMLAVLKRLAPAAADDSWTRPDSATREAILDVIAKAEER